MKRLANLITMERFFQLSYDINIIGVRAVSEKWFAGDVRYIAISPLNDFLGTTRVTSLLNMRWH